MLLKFREIEVFWAVYKSHSITDAARILNVSQPAISMMLKSAEARFGIKLFDRVSGRLRPTKEATDLFSSTENIFLEMRQFERHLSRVREGRGSILRVAATPTLALAFLHPAVMAFGGQYPDVRVIIDTGPTDLTFTLAAQGRVDFGLAYGPSEVPEIQLEDLCMCEVACIMHNDHALTALPHVSPADLVGERLVTYRFSTPLGREIAKTLRKTGLDFDVPVEAAAFTAAHLASHGDYVGLIDPFILNSGLFPDLTVRPFAPATTARVQVAFAREEPLSALCHGLLAQIRRFVPERFLFDIPIRPNL